MSKEVSDKHRADARQLVTAMDCLANRYAEPSEMAETIRARYMELRSQTDFTEASLAARSEAIAAALARVERDTFKRAAEIVAAEIELAKDFGPHHVPVLSSVRKTILLELGESQ